MVNGIGSSPVDSGFELNPGRHKTITPTLASKLHRAGMNALRLYEGTATSLAKPMMPQYHPELIDPKHRYARLLYPWFQMWKSDLENQLSFPEWLEMKEAECPALANIPRVTYLNKEELQSYRLYLAPDGRAYTENEGYLKENSSKEHPYIYVVSPEGLMYVGRRNNGCFNHSSFLGGRPVICAGELFVKDEKIAVVTDTSGHYKPFLRPEMLLNGVRAMLHIGLKDFHVNAQAKLKGSKVYEDPAQFVREYHTSIQWHKLKKEYGNIVGMTAKFAEDEIKETGSWMIWRDGHTVMVTKKTEHGYIHEHPQEMTLEALKQKYGPHMIKMHL